VTLLLLGAALPATAEPPPGPGRDARIVASGDDAQGWRDPSRWQALRIGMSRGEVIALLGEPGKITRYYAFERWEYPDALGHRVNFDERGRLAVWGAFAR
jgi:outer membrane protein assembly factor BamE (lipoprotein component of BamABCDE complex)